MIRPRIFMGEEVAATYSDLVMAFAFAISQPTPIHPDFMRVFGTVKYRDMSEQKREIKLSEVIALMNKGYTRYKKDDKGQGSVQEQLGLTVGEAKELFKDPNLKNMKCKTPKTKIAIINDLQESDSRQSDSEIDSIFS